MVEAVLLAALLLTEGRSPVKTSPAWRSGSAPSTYVFAQTQRVEVGGGRTRVSSETNVPTPRRGYFPLRVFVDNALGPRQTLAIGFYPNSAPGRPITRRIELREGERRTVVLPVPYLFRYGALKVRGPGITEKGDAHLYFNSPYGSQQTALSIGTTHEFEAWVGRPPAHTGGDLTIHSIAPEDAPTELAAYSGYSTVAIPGQGFDSLNEAQRRALESYAATGGTLVLAQGGRGLAASFPLARGEAEPDQPYGLGRLVLNEGRSPELASAFRVTDPQVTPQAAPESFRSRRGAGRVRAQGSFEALLPQATAPLGRFLLIIGIFTLAIGPGSIWVARRRGPAALLLTIPGTAFFSCAAIIGYSLIQDGFTVHAGTHGVTLLDSKQHRALQVGVTAYYANLAPGTARFSHLVAVLPPLEGSGETYGPSIDWAESAAMGGDFIPSRTYREWGFLSAEPTRARVVLKRKSGGWVAQNALGSKVSSLVFLADDVLWEVEELRDGAEAVASKGFDLPQLDPAVENRFSSAVLAEVGRPLKEGEFLARVEGQGFIPSGGLRLNHHQSATLVRGQAEQ